METRRLLTILGRLYPKRLAKKNHDVVGYMAGQKVKQIRRIVLLLDLDELIVEEALSYQPDLILTHHPFIYGTRTKVFKHDEAKKALALHLDSLPVMVYSIHTNFDEAPNGMNDALAAALGLEEVTPLLDNGMARGGVLKEAVEINAFSRDVLAKLNCPYGLLVAGGSPKIKKVALIGGGGSRSWSVAQKEGYDLYISGDAPHYVRRDVLNAGFNYLDLPHEIENIFLEKMKEVLLTIDPTFEVIPILHEFPPEVIQNPLKVEN